MGGEDYEILDPNQATIPDFLTPTATGPGTPLRSSRIEPLAPPDGNAKAKKDEKVKEKEGGENGDAEAKEKLKGGSKKEEAKSKSEVSLCKLEVCYILTRISWYFG